MNNKCTIIIFGATGDLTRRKLIPALYYMIEKKVYVKPLIVGAARNDVTVAQLLERAKPFVKNHKEAIWKQLEHSFYYHQLDFLVEHDYETLATFVSSLEQEHAMSGNRLVYLATAAHFFCPITQYLAQSGVADRTKKDAVIWQRIAYEKPFGSDSESAREINTCVHSLFDESQIYRVDHYLTKELVSNIVLLRFTNIVFEPLWNKNYVDQVQIILSEKIGIEERGGYYDTYGALADFVQSHMLELLALVAMEEPKKLTGDYIREERARLLTKVKVIDGVRGQYEGYRREKGVASRSDTETFAALYFTVNNRRWSGVPFYTKTGKFLEKKEVVIHIIFKKAVCLLTKKCPSDANYLTIRVAPDATFTLTLNSKIPGKTNEVAPVKMEFCHSCLFSDVMPTAYETLLEEIMRGEQSTSVRFDEIESAWRVIDSIRALDLSLQSYVRGSRGPEQAMRIFCDTHNIKWQA